MKTILLSLKSSLWLRYIFFALLLLPLISPAQVIAQDVKEEWVRQYAAALSSFVTDVYLAVDKEGNSYVTGIAFIDQNFNRQIVTVKYSPEGEELWSANYNLGSQGIISAIDVDETGVYIIGTRYIGEARSEVFLRKYNAADGSLVWGLNSLFDKASSVVSSGVDLLLDNKGSIYVKASTFLAKYATADGALIWGKSFTISENTPDLNSISDFALDAAGDVYLTGSAGSSFPTQELVTIKYSGTDGQLIWKQIYDSGVADRGLEIIVNKDATYVTGQSSKPAAPLPISTVFIIKYSSINGKELWFQRIADDLWALTNVGELKVIDDTIYFIGIREFWRLPSQYFLMSYNTSVGEQNWSTRMQGVVSDMEVDLLGGIYVTGSVATEKYNSINGQLLWGVPFPGRSRMVDLALDTDLNVLVAGKFSNIMDTTVSDIESLDILTIKYSQQDQDNLSCFDPLQVQLSLPPHAVRTGEQVRTTANFGDYVPGEAHNIRWEWGDQSQPTIAYFSAGDSHVTGEHTYNQAGIYKVGLDFSESCLVAAGETYKEWLVIYDPAAGSVTGGGQLLSLQTALPWMSQQLNAQFSFNVRYNQNKDTAPQGQTQLNLHQQGVFRSNAIEWLVVRGDQALWQGTGTLNGQGNYGFVASVWDGRGTGADDTGDEIRIRIWDKNDHNSIVYDNFETAGDIYDMTNPTSRIVRGQIIIHPFATASKIVSQQATLYNYPNTFKDKTTITFTAEKAGAYRLEVYDMRGKLVKQLWEGKAKQGQSYSVKLDTTTWPRGMYVTRLVSSTGSQSIRMLLER